MSWDLNPADFWIGFELYNFCLSRFGLDMNLIILFGIFLQFSVLFHTIAQMVRPFLDSRVAVLFIKGEACRGALLFTGMFESE